MLIHSLVATLVGTDILTHITHPLPGLANLGLVSPGLANLGLASPGLANLGLVNPGLANGGANDNAAAAASAAASATVNGGAGGVGPGNGYNSWNGYRPSFLRPILSRYWNNYGLGGVNGAPSNADAAAASSAAAAGMPLSVITLIMVAMTVAYPDREPRGVVGIPAAAVIGPKAISAVADLITTLLAAAIAGTIIVPAGPATTFEAATPGTTTAPAGPARTRIAVESAAGPTTVAGLADGPATVAEPAEGPTIAAEAADGPTMATAFEAGSAT
ncbi:elastin-like [Linepithema humile]|uniref:elastin-like n=1 Tax=Linepithema humile TaxID=83485 RepID=UPI00351E5CCF